MQLRASFAGTVIRLLLTPGGLAFLLNAAILSWIPGAVLSSRRVKEGAGAYGQEDRGAPTVPGQGAMWRVSRRPLP
jgi:hypothetical protein